ncbi:hypothetical protein GCM10010240_03280 [Streptomyces griseoviridis]|nr:hypothetical protein GCM10010240_03280 [Streptomyces griseoviridis]
MIVEPGHRAIAMPRRGVIVEPGRRTVVPARAAPGEPPLPPGAVPVTPAVEPVTTAVMPHGTDAGTRVAPEGAPRPAPFEETPLSPRSRYVRPFGRCAAPRADQGAVQVPSARVAVVHDA